MTVEKHPSKNFGELFWRPVLLYPDKVVIEQGEISLTYAELEARTQQVAAALSRLGIGRDDKVRLLMTNNYASSRLCSASYASEPLPCQRTSSSAMTI